MPSFWWSSRFSPGRGGVIRCGYLWIRESFPNVEIISRVELIDDSRGSSPLGAGESHRASPRIKNVFRLRVTRLETNRYMGWLRPLQRYIKLFLSGYWLERVYGLFLYQPLISRNSELKRLMNERRHPTFRPFYFEIISIKRRPKSLYRKVSRSRAAWERNRSVCRGDRHPVNQRVGWFICDVQFLRFYFLSLPSFPTALSESSRGIYGELLFREGEGGTEKSGDECGDTGCRVRTFVEGQAATLLLLGDSIRRADRRSHCGWHVSGWIDASGYEGRRKFEFTASSSRSVANRVSNRGRKGRRGLWGIGRRGEGQGSIMENRGTASRFSQDDTTRCCVPGEPAHDHRFVPSNDAWLVLTFGELASRV